VAAVNNEQGGHIVCGEATDGLEGVELAKQAQPNLILLDFTMPVMSGTETAALLKQAVPGTPIILFTLHGDEINRKYAAMMGADLVVNKARVGKAAAGAPNTGYGFANWFGGSREQRPCEQSGGRFEESRPTLVW
jgi:DNA-binding NarL/FixJ family response regulator